MASCKEQEAISGEKLVEIKRVVLTMEPAHAEGDDEDDAEVTRLVSIGNGSSWRPEFQSTDTFGLFPEGGYQIPFIPPLEEGESKQTVAIEAQGWMTKDSLNYAAYLPYNFYNRYYNKIPFSYYSKVPKQLANEDARHLDGLVLMATDIVPADSGQINATIRSQGQIICIKADMPVGGTFVKMVLASSDPQAFVVWGYMNLLAEGQPFTARRYTDYATLLLDNIAVNSGERITAFFNFAPTNIPNTDLTLYVWDNYGNCYSASRVLTAVQGAWVKGGFRAFVFKPTLDHNVPSVYLNPYKYEIEYDTGVALED